MHAMTTEHGAVLLTGRTALHSALADGAGELVVDLSGVELLDAIGLGVLVDVHRRARLADRRLVLRAATPRVARLLAATRLDRVLSVEREGLVPA